MTSSSNRPFCAGADQHHAKSHFRLDEQRLYRMPVYFGPAPGPRQGPDGRPFDWSRQPDRSLWAMDCPADAAAIERILPPGYSLDGDPVVRVELQQWRRLAWLAGRGYNTLGVKLPVRFSGTIDRVRGHLLVVIWENMPDAITTGREELGYNKIYAELADPQQSDGVWCGEARWFGHRFLEFSFRDLKDVPPDEGPITPGDGVLNLKYLPGTGPGAPADACYTTLTPPGGQLRVSKVEVAEASLTLLPTRWEDMPTQFHVVEGLRRLGLQRPTCAWRVESTGARDLADTRRLR